jgi:hypothetical protein
MNNAMATSDSTNPILPFLELLMAAGIMVFLYLDHTSDLVVSV